MYARKNNIKMEFPQNVGGVRVTSAQWIAGQSQEWRDNNGITLHEDPTMPEYDPASQKLQPLSTGEYEVVELSTQEMQSALSEEIGAKLDEVRNLWSAANEQPVEWDGVQWNGGINSAMLIDAANRGAHKSVEAMEEIFDYNNEPHLLTTTQIDSLVRALRAAAKPLFHKKQTYMRDVQAIQTSAEQEGADLAQLRRDLDAITITY